MIIYIDNTIDKHEKTHGFLLEERRMFANIAFAHWKGICFLCGDDMSIKCLAHKLPDYYVGINKKHAELGVLFDLVETVIVISYEKEPKLLKKLQGKARIITVDEAKEYNLGEKCCLLGENYTDCNFYKLIAERYKALLPGKMRSLNITLQNKLGGGGTSHTVFEECVMTDKKLTLCLADSDIKYDVTKKYPDLRKGGTVKKLLGVNNHPSLKPYKQIFDFYELPVHEAENLIPISVLRDISENEHIFTMRPGIKCLRKLYKKKLFRAILFYDFKKGANQLKGDPAYEYWYQIGTRIGDCDFPPICADILEKSIAYLSELDSNGCQRIETVNLDCYLVPLWNIIGRKVFSWGFAYKPSPTNPPRP